MRKLAGLIAAAVVAVFALVAMPWPARAGTSTGVIHVGSLGVNVMLNEMQAEGCTGVPALQGLDGWALDVGGAPVVTVVGRPGTAAGNPAGYDLNLIFLNARCEAIGMAVSASPNEVGRPVPGGTRWVLIQLALGAEVAFDAYW